MFPTEMSMSICYYWCHGYVQRVTDYRSSFRSVFVSQRTNLSSLRPYDKRLSVYCRTLNRRTPNADALQIFMSSIRTYIIHQVFSNRYLHRAIVRGLRDHRSRLLCALVRSGDRPRLPRSRSLESVLPQSSRQRWTPSVR